MSALAPNLFTRRFGDLLDIGHARLRPLAPEWTDHNAHDPGITIMELLAWVAEAQMYSASRLRRDERASFAALVGIQTVGTTAASGLLWPDRSDPASPAATFSRSIAIGADTVISVLGDDAPTFRPVGDLLWAPGTVVRIATRHANGRLTDHTQTNARGGAAFLPLGNTGGSGATLAMTFKTRDERGLFGKDPSNTRKALWAIGYRSAPPAASVVDGAKDAGAKVADRLLQATLITADQRTPLKIVSDTTANLLQTGVLLLDVSAVEGSPDEFTIEVRAPRGLPRPPRAIRIEPNVLPIKQGESIERESHVSKGDPDFTFTLDTPGLRFSASDDPITVEVSDASGLRRWKPGTLQAAGPDDEVFEFDRRTGLVTFGNGINGRAPARGADVLVSYAVSDGADGRIPRNRKWHVQGFPASFGVNLDAIVGGAGSSDFIEERREARRLTRNDHALVSPADIGAAARALPLLDVARAWVAPVSAKAPRTGVVHLIVMRGRPDGTEPAEIPETSRWLDAIRRRLVDRMPLGVRLQVDRPSYVDFSIDARVEAQPGLDPETLKTKIESTLKTRLALVSTEDADVREAGVPLSSRDVTSWLRTVEGVSRVRSVQLRIAGGKKTDSITLLPTGLPRWLSDPGDIKVVRTGSGGAA